MDRSPLNGPDFDPAADYIPFNRPWAVGAEHLYIDEAIHNRHLSSDGLFSRRCSSWLQERTGAREALLVHSCTAALELIALLLDVGPGDEVLMPSFTFVSTANAVALRGATPVFVDVREDTLNLDEELLEDAVTTRTRAIFAVHYAGVTCDMNALAGVAREHRLSLVEDAAQALDSTYHGRVAGSFGRAAALSFHETKNVIAGEGGALLLNDDEWAERAVILRDKGTNRRQFFRGEVDKYTWVDLGSSYGMSEVNAAFLFAQLEHADEIRSDRLATWRSYYDAFEDLEAAGRIRRPIVPDECEHNAHMFYVLLETEADRAAVIEGLNAAGINTVFHYVPLHSSPAGRRFGRVHGDVRVTDDVAGRLLRLPLWMQMPEGVVGRVVTGVYDVLGVPSP